MDTNLFLRDGSPAPQGLVVHQTKVAGVFFAIPSCSCTRCGGAGGSDAWKFTGWTCYRCGGSGRDPNPPRMGLYSAEKLAKLNASAAKKAATKLAKFQAEQAAAEAKAVAYKAEFEAANPGLLAGMEALACSNQFLADLLGKLARFGSLSPAQVDAARRVVERVQAVAADREAAKSAGWVGEVGKPVQVEAKLVKLLSFDGGVYGTTYLHILKVPATQETLIYKGTRVLGHEGDVIAKKFTVKEHGLREGVKQTILSRPR